jgi:hypothetical protein
LLFNKKMLYLYLNLNLMKKAILFLFMAVAFCSSCKKDQKKGAVTPAKTYKVNFNVSDFTQTLAGQSTNNLHTDGLKTNDAPPLSSFIDIIYYYVFDSTGKTIHYFAQQSNAVNFGSITDALPAGNYTVAFAAGKTGLRIGSLIYKGSPQDGLGALFLDGYGSLPWKDTFFKKIPLTVTASNITQTITMDRIVSQVTINAEDVMPANAYSIKVTARSYLRFAFATASIAGNFDNPPVDNFVQTFIIPASAKGTTNYKVSEITLNNTDPSTVIIGCYDSGGNVLASTVVNNVVVHPNTQTILSGHLFGVDNQFGITVNAKWGTPITVSF